MKGYRKISEGRITGVPETCDDDNGYLDDSIRGTVSGPIIDEMRAHGNTDFYVVVYKKVPQ